MIKLEGKQPLIAKGHFHFSIVDYKPPTYNNGAYIYPDWAIGEFKCRELSLSQ